tara:strand:+ start:235 stop:468 length:234 start_codon:yes stop_codon:yes gene_type:complete
MTDINARKYIADWDSYDGEITIYLKKPYILGGLNVAQFSEFTEDFDDDDNKCLKHMYQRILDDVKAIDPEAWDRGEH